MKLIIVFLVFSTLAIAGVTPAQMNEIRKSATDVMFDLGANPDLNPVVLKVAVISELGSRVKVKFTYEEEMFGKKTCTFYYDLNKMEVVARSALCGL